MKCKDCKHWKNEQRLLNYDSLIGFCVNSKHNFNTTVGRMIGIIDTGNLKDRVVISGNPSHDFESATYKVKPSRYLLQTDEEFGCVLFEPIKKIDNE